MEIREALQNAIAEQNEAEPVEAPEVESVEVESVEVEKTAAEARARDEKGRFAAKQKEEAEAAEVVEEVAPVEVPARKAPSSWKPEAQTIWEKAARGEPITAQEAQVLADESDRRESDFHKGIQTYKEAANFGRELHQVFTPHAEFLQQLGATPSGAVDVLMKTARVLYQGTPEQKAREVADMCQRHGIDIESLAHVQPIDPTIRALQAQQEQILQFLAAQQRPSVPDIEPSLVSEVQSFKQSHEHFDLVREDMALLLESGRASGMEDAYNKAVRMNDQAWGATQAKQQADAQAKAAAAQKAKAAAVQVKGSSPGASIKAPPASTDIRSALKANIDAMRDQL
jgi:hypothetical protein